jgi:hypothetical protein
MGQQHTVKAAFPSVIDRERVLKYGSVYRDHIFLQLGPIIDFQVAVVELNASVSCEDVSQVSIIYAWWEDNLPAKQMLQRTTPLPRSR